LTPRKDATTAPIRRPIEFGPDIGDTGRAMELDSALVGDLRRAHGVHTVILYGSRARGDATAESDVDSSGSPRSQ
jgi:Nucleotidyltransferase domain